MADIVEAFGAGMLFLVMLLVFAIFSGVDTSLATGLFDAAARGLVYLFVIGIFIVVALRLAGEG